MAGTLPDWSGRTVVCLASGPSLTQDDVDAVRATGHPVVVTNTTFRVAPWADMLYGYDRPWWRMHIDEIRRVFAGLLFCESMYQAPRGVHSSRTIQRFRPFGNSGASAVSIAICAGARRVIMLGYDCQKTDGKSHHHGDHPHGLQNCDSLPRWPAKFARLAKYADSKGAVVINASRTTALECFPRMALAECL